MRSLLSLILFFIFCLSPACRAPLYPENPGNLFIRQQICDINEFKKSFLTPALKTNGFLAYSLHRDIKDPKTYILTLKCTDLRKAIKFVQSSGFHTLCVGSGLGSPVIWAGVDVRERKYENKDKMSGGIVIANNQVKSYEFWKKCFDAEGQHHHADRGYSAGNYSIHHLAGKPDIVLVVHEASEISNAPPFMTSEAMKGIMESSGVTGIEIWYGTNLEEGTF